MNKTVQVNIGGFVFFLDEDAFQHLQNYLQSLRQTFRKEDGADEIIGDIERRIAELFKEYLGTYREVVSLSDVKKVVEIMGKPEDFDEEATGEQTFNNESFGGKTKKRIFRDTDNRVLGGVASGLAAFLNIDPVITRIIFIISMFAGFGVVVYLVLWIAIPEAKTTADKLMMKGENVNIENIEKAIKKEFEEVKKKLEKAGERLEKAGDELSSKSFKREARGFGKFIEDFIMAILQIVKHVLSFVFKFVGVVILLIASFVLITFILSLLGSGINFNGLHLGPTEVMEYTRAIFVNSTHMWLVIGSLISISIMIVLSILLLGVRLILNQKWYNPAWNTLISLILFASFGTLVVSGIWLAGSYSNDSRYTIQEEIPNISSSDTLYISTSTNMRLEDYGWNQNLYWIAEGGKQYLRRVSISIVAHKAEHTLIELHKESNGRTKSEARENAKSILYSYQIDGAHISFDNYIELAEDQRFRSQGLEIKLYVPEGQSIYLAESMIDITKFSRKAEESKEYELVGNFWRMSDSGLVCISCRLQ